MYEDDDELVRYLIGYLRQNEHKFLMDNPAEIDYDDLEKVIKAFYANLL